MASYPAGISSGFSDNDHIAGDRLAQPQGDSFKDQQEICTPYLLYAYAALLP